MSVVCYPQPGKARSRQVLEAFAAGAVAARVLPVLGPALEREGGAAFYGVVGIEHLLRLAIAEKREYFYGDNAFFDRGRGKFFRFARNCLQLHDLAKPDHARAKAQGLHCRPWRRDGRRIVVVPQSEHFMRLVAQDGWLFRVLRELEQHTGREIVVRLWRRDKDKAARTLHADLKDAWALVTHMSAAANEALLYGVPVFVSGRCAAAPMASGELSAIESPRYPEGREEWAAGLAAMQWTLEELRSGMAWRALKP